MITSGQNKRLHYLLNSTGKKDVKQDLVKHYTGGRTGSSKEMQFNEANSLIKHLESYERQGKEAPAHFIPDSDNADRMRKKIIHYAHEMKWEHPGGKADMARINAWCIKYGQFHKALNEHNEKELAALVTQFENTYRSFLTSLSNAK